jgi:hypothetical protein
MEQEQDFIPALLDDCRGTIDCGCLVCEHLPVEGQRKKIQPTSVECAFIHPAFAGAMVATDACGHIWQMPEELKRTHHMMNAMGQLFSVERWSILEAGTAGNPVRL